MPFLSFSFFLHLKTWQRCWSMSLSRHPRLLTIWDFSLTELLDGHATSPLFCCYKLSPKKEQNWWKEFDKKKPRGKSERGKKLKIQLKTETNRKLSRWRRFNWNSINCDSNWHIVVFPSFRCYNEKNFSIKQNQYWHFPSILPIMTREKNWFSSFSGRVNEKRKKTSRSIKFVQRRHILIQVVGWLYNWLIFIMILYHIHVNRAHYGKK